MKTTSIILVVLLGAVLRFSALLTPPADDITHFAVTAQIAQRGGNLYAEQYYYNYTPVIAQIVRMLPAPLFISLRLLIDAADLLVAILLALVAAPRHRLLAFAAWWCNPVTILIVAGTGQFESVALVPFLLAVLVARRHPDSPAIWLLCLTSILVKHVLVFQIWALFVALWGPRKALLRMIALGAVFVLSFVPYLPDGAPRIVTRVLLYASWTGRYGLGLALPTPLVALICYSVLIGLPVLLWRRGWGAERILSASFLGFATLSYGMTEQLLIPTFAWLAHRRPLALAALCAPLALLYIAGQWQQWNTVMLAVWAVAALLFASSLAGPMARVSLRSRALAPTGD